MQNNLSIIVLAAGKGTRMKSSLPKVMHKVAGREMLNLVLDEAEKLTPRQISVVVSEDFAHYQNEIVKNRETDIKFVVQEERLGTGHAARVGLGVLDEGVEKILVLYGDTPLIETETLQEMLGVVDEGSAVCVLGFETGFENQYGRLIVDDAGTLQRIVEFKDANEDERAAGLCNSGVMAFDGAKFSGFLDKIDDKNAAGEFYLTDAVAIAKGDGCVCGFVATDEDEVLGVNSRLELAKVEDIKQNRLREKFMESGVTLLDAFSTYFSWDTVIENDVIVHQNVVFGPGVKVSCGAEIKSFSHIEGAKLGVGVVVGPFARIRPGTEIGKGVRVGNFVEVKNSVLEEGAKVGHLSYIGDAEIGEGANIGAGVITCNYDGVEKHKTEVGGGAFVGSNSALVAPVKIGSDALVAAGTVVVKDACDGDLVVARSEQRNIKNGAKRIFDSKK